ncbi:pyridoxamine 5'-phosphate oxidase [Thermoleophilia bacterium SCSIO 60948]|nr:pyridoxamine 5'-phosphate oxidase [Thermoleophilia bacterium SCSIO 60948]
MSRRSEIRLSVVEQSELLDAERVLIVTSIGPRGWPHAMPMWFVARDLDRVRNGGLEPLADSLAEPAEDAGLGERDAFEAAGARELWIWTYAKSQKVRNLERDPRATLLVETGHSYQELRGLQVEAEAEIIRDSAAVLDFGKQLTLRYAPGLDEIGPEAERALAAQAEKRVAIRFAERRVASWDHRKLGGGY